MIISTCCDKREKDSKSVPVRIEGCASGARNTVVASVLGNPKEKLFLPRDSNILYSLTSEERHSVLKLFHIQPTETYQVWTLSRLQRVFIQSIGIKGIDYSENSIWGFNLTRSRGSASHQRW